MSMRKPMTDVEKRLFQQAIIKEYKLKYEKNIKKKYPFNDFIDQMRAYAPINIMLGIIASILLVYIAGWTNFFHLLLSGVIWITIISTALSALSKVK